MGVHLVVVAIASDKNKACADGTCRFLRTSDESSWGIWKGRSGGYAPGFLSPRKRIAGISLRQKRCPRHREARRSHDARIRSEDLGGRCERGETQGRREAFFSGLFFGFMIFLELRF